MASEDRLVGKTVAHFEVLELLGSGGMSKVYRVRNQRLDCIRALKVLDVSPREDRDDDTTQQLAQRFLVEARAAAKLVHDNIIRVHDADTWGTLHYIEMELVEGPTLAAMIESRKWLPLPEALAITKQVAAALHTAHSAGIIHRDVKASNVLMTKDGRPKLSDFGLARNVRVPSDLTLAGQILGTPAYMSPEQCRGMEADQQSDIYSLGVLFYHMLTGRLPYTGNVLQLIEAHKNEALPDPRPSCAHITDRCWALLQKMTAKEPMRRCPCVAELLVDLDRVLASGPCAQGEISLTAETLAMPHPARRAAAGAATRPRFVSGRMLAAGLACLLAAGAIGFALTRLRPSQGQASVANSDTGFQAPARTVPGLAAKLSVRGQRKGDNGHVYTVVLGQGDVLYSDEQFQVRYQADRDAHVYLMLYGATGKVEKLFPNPAIEVTNPAKAGVEYILPAANLWYVLDKNAGLETVCLLAANEPLHDLDKIVEDVRVAGAISESEREEAERLAKLSRDVKGIRGSLPALYVPEVSEARVEMAVKTLTRHCACVKAVTFQHKLR